MTDDKNRKQLEGNVIKTKAIRSCSRMFLSSLRLVTVLAWNAIFTLTIEKSKINPLLGGWLYAFALTAVLVLVSVILECDNDE